jgi:hypothetical protein
MRTRLVAAARAAMIDQHSQAPCGWRPEASLR